ncbi:MAG TPA: aminoglycoside phosphotransferase family protein [Gaiellaceae bacterium]|nr:aminoglycoside phosphotransferase family protein [Gaiellaceae bacterium]
MDVSDVERATGAAIELASALELSVDEARILSNSNKLGLRLLPCEVFARVAFKGEEVFESELAIAQGLARTQSPVAALDPRVEPRVYDRDGFAVTFWRYYEPVAGELPAEDYARALERLHDGMAQLGVEVPRFTERVAEAQRLVVNPQLSPRLQAADRELLDVTLRSCVRAIDERSSPEQLLHGEPHPGNVLETSQGPLFVDLETCCRGPVEFDLAHVPEAVSASYSGADDDLVCECRRLVLAMVAAWRWDSRDQFPNGERAGRALLGALHAGPPWPTLDAVMSAG